MSILITILSVLLITACSGSDSSNLKGNIEVRVTDAPPQEVTKILITAKKLEVHRTNVDEESGWTTVLSDETTFDLVAVQGIEKILGNDDIQIGGYNQIRVDITSVLVTLKGQEVKALKEGKYGSNRNQ